MISINTDSETFDSLVFDEHVLRYRMHISDLEPMKRVSAKGQSGARRKYPAIELSYGLIAGECILSLQNDLPDECRAYGIQVQEVRVTRIQPGSLELWFEDICEGLIYIGGVYAGYELIAKIASKIARECVKRIFRGQCKVETTLMDGDDLRPQADGNLKLDKSFARKMQVPVNSRNLVHASGRKVDVFSFCLGSIDALLFLVVVLVFVGMLLHVEVIG